MQSVRRTPPKYVGEALVSLLLSVVLVWAGVIGYREWQWHQNLQRTMVTALQDVVEGFDDPQQLRTLLRQGASIHTRSPEGFTPILAAATAGDIRLISDLVHSGANVNDRLADGSTVLMLATLTGDADTLRLLVARGADVNARDHTGQTALMVAASCETHPDARLAAVARVLLEARADPQVQDNHGQTALDLARQMNHPLVARLLRSALSQQ